uniref:Molybdopterin synthase catalytic subunit n=1 Tax=Sphaeramia orbicularis TaxID=375764 RepID=A0A673AWN5_9TELE
MVQSELAKLSANVRARWPTSSTCVSTTDWGETVTSDLCAHLALCLHSPLTSDPRWVEVGEASVVIAISSPHRRDGQEAIQFYVTQLKAAVPIWKKEVYDTQESSWKENAECPWGGAKD